jgi:hypothetical protein
VDSPLAYNWRMAGLIQILASLALLGVTTYLVKSWEQFIGDTDIAFLIGFPAMCLIAWIYDRRQESKRRLDEASQSRQIKSLN